MENKSVEKNSEVKAAEVAVPISKEDEAGCAREPETERTEDAVETVKDAVGSPLPATPSLPKDPPATTCSQNLLIAADTEHEKEAAAPKDDYIKKKEHVLCLIGSDMQRYYGEREIFSLLFKHFKPHLRPQTLPIDSIYKKKGQGFAFINFKSRTQMKEFQDLFSSHITKSLKIFVRECNDYQKVQSKQFKSFANFLKKQEQAQESAGKEKEQGEAEK